jgi:ABC-type glutathione transport system ATPase component
MPILHQHQDCASTTTTSTSASIPTILISDCSTIEYPNVSEKVMNDDDNDNDDDDQDISENVASEIIEQQQDECRIDVSTIVDDDGGGGEMRSPPLILHWENLEYKVKVRTGKVKRSSQTVLYPQSAFARPGEVLAIMGPSGSGKTSMY